MMPPGAPPGSRRAPRGLTGAQCSWVHPSEARRGHGEQRDTALFLPGLPQWPQVACGAFVLHSGPPPQEGPPHSTPQLSFLDQTQASSPGLGRGKSKVAAHTSGPLRGHLGEGGDSVVERTTQEKATRSLASEPPDRLRGESQLMVWLESLVGRTAVGPPWVGLSRPQGRRVEGDKTQDTGPAGGPRCPETRRPGGVCEFPPPRLLGPHGPRPQVTAVQTRRAGGRQQGHSGVMVSQRVRRGARGGKYVRP